MFTVKESHDHSLTILNTLYEYDDFMESIRTVLDLGCGDGHDANWWATQTTRDQSSTPLNIRCIGVDNNLDFPQLPRTPNLTYQQVDFEDTIENQQNLKFDILWCHNAFQYCVNPIATLVKWRQLVSHDSMLVISLPQTINIKRRLLAAEQESGSYYHYSMVNLIQMLSLTGWDCRSGFFKKNESKNKTINSIKKKINKIQNTNTHTFKLNLLKKFIADIYNHYHSH